MRGSDCWCGTSAFANPIHRTVRTQGCFGFVPGQHTQYTLSSFLPLRNQQIAVNSCLLFLFSWHRFLVWYSWYLWSSLLKVTELKSVLNPGCGLFVLFYLLHLNAFGINVESHHVPLNPLHHISCPVSMNMAKRPKQNVSNYLLKTFLSEVAI